LLRTPHTEDGAQESGPEHGSTEAGASPEQTTVSQPRTRASRTRFLVAGRFLPRCGEFQASALIVRLALWATARSPVARPQTAAARWDDLAREVAPGAAEKNFAHRPKSDQHPRVIGARSTRHLANGLCDDRHGHESHTVQEVPCRSADRRVPASFASTQQRSARR